MLAQIASILSCTPFRVWGKVPPKGLDEIKNFLLKFTSEDDTPAERVKSEEELREEATQKSKAAGWGAFLGDVQRASTGGERALPPGVVNLGAVPADTQTTAGTAAVVLIPAPNRGVKRPAVDFPPRE